MKLIRVAAAVLNQTPLDWEGNKANMLEAIRRARAENVSILCLPELCITGYGCEDAFHAPGVQGMAWTLLNELLPATHGMLVCVGLPLQYQNGIFNVACFINNGEILGFVAKKYLAGDGIHYEPRWFKPWPAGVRTTIELDGKRYPLGDLGFNVSGIKIGFEICEDAWVAKRPGADLAVRGIDMIMNPSASHFAFGKDDIRQRFVQEGSRAFSTSYIYANLLGCESGRVIYDGGAIIASGGKLLALGQRFSFEDVVLTSAVVDVEFTRLNQMRSASFRPELEDVDTYFVSGRFDFPRLTWEEAPLASPENPGAGAEAWENSPAIKKEEFSRAVTLALYDYMRKSRSRGFVLSLSGGADSSAVAVLIHLMVVMGMNELGRERFLAKIAYVPGITALPDAKAIVGALLTCAYQATRNSGDVTRTAARELAHDLGARYHEFEIDTLFEGYVAMVSQALGREISWETDDIALQNIQARVRSPGIWMLANIAGALLLATSNRSEAAVGYATMDGDTSGGLSPVAGIDKAFLRDWLAWMEIAGPLGAQPLPILGLVNRQQPTAELRPAAEAQTDEKDLMPYPVLDAIERAAIRDKKMPVEAFHLMRALFGDRYADADLGLWVKRFFRLWCQNQWKRERYAPSFHLDDENLDPKTWCRFPILSGGFTRELAELDQLLEGMGVSAGR
ncbi:MAG: synthetase [Cyanobacteria bacterium RYN_339]|nr:synthetase [Cyanobacteria bacterium RYN_339]